ncbi:MAG TPA: DUF3857 domain-containing protein [Candidatus Acidoferrales bacterium]|nr:DUF3857 domain-containing protein [Candidatus Acidoferrales bacterium]
MKPTFLFLSAFFAPAILISQQWPVIPADELQLTRAPRGLRRNAILLYRSLAFDDQKKTAEAHLRIKILTEEGREQANIEIPFVKGSTEIADLRARTVQPDGKEQAFDGAVYEKTIVRARKFRYLAKTFTLPDVQVGSILEYRYTIKRKEVGDASWHLQHELYTLHARFSIKPAKIEGVSLRAADMNVRDGVLPKWNADGSATLELDNVPALESEEYTLPERELMPRFEFYYEGPGSNIETYWTDTFQAWAEAAERFLGKPKDLADAAASIVGASDSSDQKLRKIYARVQQLRNLSHEGGRTSQELKRQEIKENKNVRDVWARGYGVGAEIDLLFVALARAAGFDASFVRYAGRNQGVFHRNLPDRRQFNGVLAAVTLPKQGGGAEDIFLDPAVPTLRYGMLDWDSTGVTGVRLRSADSRPAATSYEFISIPNRHEWGGSILRKSVFDLDSAGRLWGTVTVSFDGQDAILWRKQAKEGDFDEATKREELEGALKAWVIDGARVKLLKMSGWEDSLESLTADFSVEIPDFATVTPRRLMVPVTAFRTHHLLQDATQHANRMFAFYFKYAWEEDDDTTIRLPAGTDTEELPAPVSREMPKASYQSSWEKLPGVLHTKRRLAINAIFYPDPRPVREFFSDVRVGDENIALVHRPARDGN